MDNLNNRATQVKEFIRIQVTCNFRKAPITLEIDLLHADLLILPRKS